MRQTPEITPVITGNGPAGLATSAFLSGWHPYYTGEHPDAVIHSHFTAGENAGKSLLDQDLSWFAEECAERINPSVSPYTALYDTLVRPVNADGSEAAGCLEWKFHPERAVPHLVFGDEGIGGSWNSYDPDMRTVSQAEWMSLPGYSITEALRQQGINGSERATARMVRCYMEEYTDRLRLRGNLHYGPISNISKRHCKASGEDYWRVESQRLTCKLNCKKVVLACGKNMPRKLGIEGEESDAPKVAYDLPTLKSFISSHERNGDIGTVIVVGDGISAADAVSHCLLRGIRVLHVVKRGPKELGSKGLP